MNVHAQSSSRKAPAGAQNLTACVVTASYAPDFERCRLLCETMDRHVEGSFRHLLLVESRDVQKFKALETGRRIVVDERDLLPSWLRPFSDPSSGFKRRIWLSPWTKPLRGWHVQQLRRIAIAEHLDEQVLVYCDSDVAFLRPFSLSAFNRGNDIRLYRRISDAGHVPAPDDHLWQANAARILGIAAPKTSGFDYINTLIAWRRDTVRAMRRHIELVSGKGWLETIASDRKFSECTLYGRYVDEVTGGAHHFVESNEFCRVHWNGTPMTGDEINQFVGSMGPGQVAIGMQSFIGTDVGQLRRALGL